MKRYFRNILLMALIVISVPRNIEAASPSFYVNNNSVEVGGSFTVTVVGGTNREAMYQFSIVSSDSSVVSGISYASSQAEGNTMVFTLPAKSVGNASISLSVVDAVDVELDDVAMPGNSINLTVKEKSTPSDNSPAPAPTVDDPSRPGHSEPVTEAPQETEAEKAERIEREEKEAEEKKKAELEAAKKVPLVSSFDIISASDKLNGEVLKTIETESEKFDYEYTLPRRIDAFKLDLKSDATLDYVKDHKFADGENEKKIVVKAHNDDFEQTINILIKRNTDAFVERKVGDKSLAVYEDELLDALMKEKGFERKTFKEGDQEVSYFSKGKVNMQLLVDDENNAQWHLLNDKNEAVKPLAMVLDKEGNVLFILEANEEMRKETLHGNKYETKSRDLGKEFANIDKELKIENKYGAWEFADGEIVWAMNENLEEGLYHIAHDGTIKAAVVAFDQVDEKMKNIALGTSIALGGLIAANIAYFIVSKTKKDDVI